MKLSSLTGLFNCRMPSYFIIYKPYHTLSQFSSQDDKKCLKDYFQVGKDVYPVGRLDYDSEGLLILTNDSSLNHRLLNPGFLHEREYWVQVEGDISASSLEHIQEGVEININGKEYTTLPCKASRFRQPPRVPERIPPIRFRKNVPTSWIRLVLTEGKNRQVRKMTAALGYPTLRLIRHRIEKLELGDMKPGEMRLLSRELIYQKLFGK